MPYLIESYDVVNGNRTVHRILKPEEAFSLSEVDKYQAKLQRRIQRLHRVPVTVLVNYKVPVEEHVPW
jgi:hypothetical protein